MWTTQRVDSIRDDHDSVVVFPVSSQGLRDRLKDREDTKSTKRRGSIFVAQSRVYASSVEASASGMAVGAKEVVALSQSGTMRFKIQVGKDNKYIPKSLKTNNEFRMYMYSRGDGGHGMT